jgi:electron transfer flavoprotein beta subunit
VGSELAELLDIPHASGVTSIEQDEKGGVTVKLNRDDSIVTQNMPIPCLLCMDGDINTPRLPSFKRKRNLPDGYLRTLTLEDFSDQNETHYGLAGSPTQVEAIFPPDKGGERELYTGTGHELGRKLAEILSEKKMIAVQND